MVSARALRPARQQLPTSSPSDPRGRWRRADHGYRGGSPEIQRLLAWIDANIAHQDLGGVLAGVESALLREEARLAGQLSPAERYARRFGMDDELRALFALPGEQVLERILGWWDVDLNWHPGLAGLVQREAEAVTLSLYGLKPQEIQQALRPSKRRGQPPALESIYVWLSDARGKLRRLFGVDP